jgi:hypothetical protein
LISPTSAALLFAILGACAPSLQAQRSSTAPVERTAHVTAPASTFWGYSAELTPPPSGPTFWGYSAAMAERPAVPTFWGYSAELTPPPSGPTFWGFAPPADEAAVRARQPQAPVAATR